MKRKQNRVRKGLGRLGVILLAALIPGILTGCDALNFSKSAEKVQLKMALYIPGVTSESAPQMAHGLQGILDLYQGFPASEKDKEPGEAPPVLLVPDEVTVARLDCPRASALTIKAEDWQKGIWASIAKALGNVTPKRLKDDWEKNALSRITAEALTAMCSSEQADPVFPIEEFSAADDRTLLFVMTRNGQPRPDILPAGTSPEQVTTVSTAAALWKSVQKRLSETPRPQAVQIAVFYDPLERCPTLEEVLTAYHEGDYAGAAGLVHRAEKCLKDKNLQSLLQARPTVDVSFWLRNKGDAQGRTLTQVDETVKLTHESRYALNFSISQGPVHLYVVQVDSSGTVGVIYPNAEYDCSAREIAETLQFRCPGDLDRGFFLDEVNRGVEKIYVLASREENRSVSQWIQENDYEELRGYLEGLEQRPPTVPGVVFKVLSFTHE